MVSRPVIREVAPYRDVVGKFEAERSLDLRSHATGRLVKACFVPGKMVEAGTLLFEIDSRPYQARVDRAKAEVQRAETRVKGASDSHDRMQMLLSKHAIGEREASRADTELEEAVRHLKMARSDLEVATLQMESTRVTAPFRGRMGHPALDAGNIVVADQTVLGTLVTVDPVAVAFEVDERTVLQLRKQDRENGGKGSLRLGPVEDVAAGLVDEEGFPHKGKLADVGDRFDPNLGTLRCRAIVPNHDELIMPGMFARVRMTTGKPVRSVLVPGRAVRVINGEQMVFVVSDQGEAALRRVSAGLPYGDLMVVEGVTADEWIAVEADWQKLTAGRTYPVEKRTTEAP